MKRKMCFLLAALLFYVCYIPVNAAQTANLVSFHSMNDFDNWRRRSFPVTDNHKAINFARVGNHSLKMIDFNIENNWSCPVNQSVEGMSYLNMWLYCDNPNHITVDFRPTIGGKKIITQWTVTLDWTGWKLFSFPLAGKTGSVTEILFSTEGYGFGSRGDKHDGYPENTVENLAAGSMCLNHMWLSEKEPQEQQFGDSSTADGASLVKHNLSRISFSAKGICDKSLTSGEVTIEPSTALHVITEEDKLVVCLDEDLAFGTDYIVSLNDGFYDKNGMNFKEKAIYFRTRGENENIPPEVRLTAPAADSRFFPGDTIMLAAEAIDENGTVEYVEFYCNGILIEGSRCESTTGEYVFEWTNGVENLAGDEITAVACDNDGAKVRSDGARIIIADYHAPRVVISSPEDGVTLYHSISGMIQENELKISAQCSDADGAVQEVRFYLNDTLLYSETKNTAAVSYTYLGEIAAGEYQLRAEAVDNDGLTAVSEVSLRVFDLGKQLPELTQKKSDKIYAERNCNKKLNTGVWQTEAEIVCEPQALHILQLAGNSTYDILSFKADGSIYADGRETTLKNKSDDVHHVKIVVNAESSILQCMLNGVTVIENMSCNAENYQNGAVLRLTNAAEDKTYFADCSFYRLIEAASLKDVTLYDAKGEAIGNTNAVDVYADGITLSFSGGIQTDSLEGNLILEEMESGERVPLALENGKVYIKGKLKSDRSYRLNISSNIANQGGAGLCGDSAYKFKTAKNPVTVRFTSDVSTLSEARNGIAVKAALINNTQSEQECEIICAVYDGNRQRLPVVTKRVKLAAGAHVEEALFVEMPGSTENTVLEAFAVKSAETPIPVGDAVLRLQYQ